MTISLLRNIFLQCNNILNYKFSILSFEISLYQFIAFDILLFLVLKTILSIFHRGE